MPITILIYARFLRNFTCACMKEWRIFMHKISQAYIDLAYRKPFITELFEEPSYLFSTWSTSQFCCCFVLRIYVASAIFQSYFEEITDLWYRSGETMITVPLALQANSLTNNWTSIPRVLLKQYRSPTDPNKFKSAISAQYVKACKRKVWKTVYFQYSKF